MTALATPLRLLSRPGCHLCDDAAATLRRLGVRFATIKVNSDVELEKRYAELVPVLLYGEREIIRAPLEERTLREALAKAGIVTERAQR